ncbi:MAG: DUF3667 domain-containing protein [Aureispira sp.]|nr:DUF3667 domain-containing protein [Aureispira sp.]
MLKGGQCSNCKGELYDTEKYCSECGQKVLKKVSFWVLLQDVLGNIFTLESKVFRTLGNLVFLPGNLTKAFLAGRHQYYYTPGKLFLFLMAIHFILLGSLIPSLENDSLKKIAYKEMGKEEFCKSVDSIPALKKYCDQIQFDSIPIQIGDDIEIKGNIAVRDLALLPIDSLFEIHAVEGFWGRFAGRQMIKAVKSPNSFYTYFFSHLSWAILFMIPLLGLLLKILYRKNYYLDHIVFALHFHSFIFLLLSFLYVFEQFNWLSSSTVVLTSLIVSSLYLCVALWRNYPQKFWKLLLKIFLFSIGYILIFVLVTFLFILFSFVLFA